VNHYVKCGDLTPFGSPSPSSSGGYLTLRFTDGTVKRYGYNDLAFWEEDGQRGG